MDQINKKVVQIDQKAEAEAKVDQVLEEKKENKVRKIIQK